MHMIQFLPIDKIHPNFQSPLAVETVPVKGDHVYIQGKGFVVEHLSHFFDLFATFEVQTLVNLRELGAEA